MNHRLRERQHCCNDDQQSQWENGDFKFLTPCRSETAKNIESKIGQNDYAVDL